VKRLALALVVVLLGAAIADAQWGRMRRAPARMATADSFDGAFNFCRGMFAELLS
jgi:hypothetical protein